MSRDHSDYRARSRSRSRGRDNRRDEVCNDAFPCPYHFTQTSRSSYEEKLVRDSRAIGSDNDKDLAAELGYSAPAWEKSSSHQNSSEAWGVAPARSIPPPPPASSTIPPPPPSQSPDQEAEDWGYTAKPYVPSVSAIGMPVLSKPMMVPPPPPPAPASSSQPAHVVLENVPADLNMMSLLSEHFKQFGEVVSIQCLPNQSRAFVDFKTQEIADAAAGQPVLGVPSIHTQSFSGPARLSALNRPALRPALAANPRYTPPYPTGLTKNLVLESEAAQRAREKREQQAEIEKRRKEFKTACTAQVQALLPKVLDKSLPEEVRMKYQKMLESVKAKISEIQREDDEKKKKATEAMNKILAMRYKAYEKQAREDSSIKQQQLTLDLRSRCVRISGLPEELTESVVLVEYLRAMGMKDLDEVIWVDDRTSAVLRFKSHAAAESLIKHELAFKAEWVTNEAAQSLANFNPVERVEIEEEDETTPVE